jgi:glycosyltransferase involved in cell wall biosynthesis
MGRAGAEKSLISLLNSFDHTRVEVSLLSVIGRGELFADVPKQVRVLNENPSLGAVLGTGGALHIARTVLARMFLTGYIFRFIPYALKKTYMQLRVGRLQFEKLLWLPLAMTAPRLDGEYDLCVAFIEGAATYYTAERVRAENRVAFVHVNYDKAGYQRSHDFKYYEKMDYICCISDAVKGVFCGVYPELADRVRVFPNIILADEIRANAQGEGGFDDGFGGLRILTVGRLHPQKGYDAAIAAFAKVLENRREDIKWYVIGDGTERRKLKKLIKRYGLDSKFVLLGSRPNPLPYVKQCDVYVQPSRFEGFPLTLQEALILNKPCVTTNFEGVSELLTDGEDALVVQFGVENIADAVTRMVGDENLRKLISENTKSIKFDFPNRTPFLYDIADGKGWDGQ